MAVKKAWMKGFGFGLTSGIITTLGMMVGLNAGTHSKVAVIGGILLIAIGDSLADAMAVHVSEESIRGKNDGLKDVWVATFSTLIFKVIFASIFVIPVLTLPLDTAIFVSIAFGVFLISVFSYLFAVKQKVSAWHVVFEHLAITCLVILLTYLVGTFVNSYFGGA
ncbi:hypothetical protein HOG17_01300 [Candidatus Peregrinibacteria bacterium]|jgi:vacuolar iron transporter family protein|nr:hypothetical protein [Candidatus Peregrinibacteria bacterium]MBT4148368.1 hypothetical protein [Candidatus Peregrinibacteria bacterium]MBT4365995.1 hypothetical protein [Candidatus Peregrinibacteria bacterium]MBT4456620.1 hypothetical protein [Candidatus Peregrinibacteria bacterium]